MVPNARLWLLLIAAQAVDVGFMVLGLFGVESAALSQHEPRLVVTSGVFTHSIAATVVWSAVCGGLAWRLRGRRVGLAVGAVVASHWLTDLVVHTPDLPLGLSQHPAVGLGLWMHPPWAWLVECVLVVGGAAFLKPTVSPAGSRALAVLVGFLLLLQTLSEFVVPTPASFAELAVSALGVYAATAWLGWRVDRVGLRKP